MNTIVPYTHPSGLSGQELRHSNGSSVRVLDYGAHVCSWTREADEVLFMSSTAEFKQGTAIRGGIPVIFPQFSRRGALAAHGFARNSMWDRVVVADQKDEHVSLGLRLTDSPATREVWPHAFVLDLVVSLGDSLSLTLNVKNSGLDAFTFTSALHTYFKVADIASTSVLGLGNRKFVDFLAGDREFVQQTDRLEISGALDRVYPAAPGTLAVSDGAGHRTIELQATHFPDAVIWNPWEENNRKMKDLHPEAFREFLCVESGTVLVPKSLEPGEGVSYSVRYETRPL